MRRPGARGRKPEAGEVEASTRPDAVSIVLAGSSNCGAGFTKCWPLRPNSGCNANTCAVHSAMFAVASAKCRLASTNCKLAPTKCRVVTITCWATSATSGAVRTGHVSERARSLSGFCETKSGKRLKHLARQSATEPSAPKKDSANTAILQDREPEGLRANTWQVARMCQDKAPTVGHGRR